MVSARALFLFIVVDPTVLDTYLLPVNATVLASVLARLLYTSILCVPSLSVRLESTPTCLRRDVDHLMFIPLPIPSPYCFFRPHPSTKARYAPIVAGVLPHWA